MSRSDALGAKVPNFKLDPTVWGSRCSPHTAAQFGVEHEKKLKNSRTEGIQ